MYYTKYGTRVGFAYKAFLLLISFEKFTVQYIYIYFFLVYQGNEHEVEEEKIFNFI